MKLEEIKFKKKNLRLFLLLIIGIICWILFPIIKDLNPNWKSIPEKVYYEPEQNN